MYARALRTLNPWWEDPAWRSRDKHLLDYAGMRVRWTPKWIDDLSLEPFSVNFVLGPRQVGKTTGLKLLIDRLLRRVDAEDVLYVDCEIFPDFVTMREALEDYIEAAGPGGGTKYIFLDEVTSVPGWWRAVKYLIDSGRLRDAVVSVSGSSSLRVRGDIELFPGRTGGGRVVEVLPLGFGEYVEVHGVRNYRLEYGRVLELFDRYLETGGFPLTVNGFPASHVLRALVGEVVRFGKSLEVTKEVLSSLISRIPSPLSFRAVAKGTSGYSYKTVQEYLEFLRDLYVLEFAHLRQGAKILYRRDKKMFFRDPLLLKILSAWTGTRYLRSALIENVVQEHMYRRFGEVYYYRNSHEVDVVAGGLRVEVKAGKPHRRYPRDVIVLEEEEVPGFLIELGGAAGRQVGG